MTIYTIGHSNIALEKFLALLEQHEIRFLADIRRFPASRKHPHFNGPALKKSLEEKEIAYGHFEALGGRRPKKKGESENTAWTVQSFQNYADYMETPEFQAAARQLMKTAERERTAIMCAEALYFRCHRRLAADYLTFKGIEVLHIQSGGKLLTHELTPFARIRNGRLTYPGQKNLL